MVSSVLATVIKFVHFVLIMFIIVVPFTSSEWLLTLHAIGMPGLIIHWLTNNNVCSLTLLESQLTGESMDRTFIGKIVHPFFEVNNYTVYSIVIGLWLLTLYKLYPTRYRMLRACLHIAWNYLYSWIIYFRNFFAY